MTKRLLMDIPILPRELRPIVSINSPSQISDNMLDKIAKSRRREMRSKKLLRMKIK